MPMSREAYHNKFVGWSFRSLLIFLYRFVALSTAKTDRHKFSLVYENLYDF
jgi:hypothetical protein